MGSEVEREIVRILEERSARGEWTDIAAIAEELKRRGKRRSIKTIHRLLSNMEDDPDRIKRHLAAADAEPDRLRTEPVLISRAEGRRRLYMLRRYELRLEDLRHREELREIVRWMERFEVSHGPYARAVFALDAESRILRILSNLARRHAEDLASLSWADAAEKTAALLEGLSNPRDKEPEIFLEALSDALFRFRPDLLEWRDPDRSELPTVTSRGFCDLARGLRKEMEDIRILTPIPDSPAGGSLFDAECATDSGVLRAPDLPSIIFEVFLGAARIEMRGHGEPRYAYATEPPIGGAQDDPFRVPRDISFIRWADDEEDEYARRARRSYLDRIHYMIESDVLNGVARWVGDRPPPGFPLFIIHDGRLLPELLRPHDFMESVRPAKIGVAGRERGTSRAAQYRDINRRTLQLFLNVYTSEAGKRIVGMVKMERISLPVLLLLGTLLYFEKDPKIREEIMRWVARSLAADSRFSLRLATGILGSALRDAVGRPIMIGPFPRPVSAFQWMPPERLEELKESLESRESLAEEELALLVFLRDIYLPLIRDGVIYYFYCVPYPTGEQPICFPRLELFRRRASDRTAREAFETALRLASLLSGSEWEPDLRHDEESGYRLYVPRIARDVDKGALIASGELRRHVTERINQIRRQAIAEGYPF
ncbi:hypothetical protein [Thermoflexus sp.]|uniref:hypothetical protein n=1 Tax=Thermoflexus sp. TaxID=1969742 RepID=UPI002ADDD4F0|nr:hypothetical protein [Thermoflexus sp.]